MLLDPTVPCSLLAVLESARSCFTAPSFETFTGLVVGLVAQPGRCTVTGMLTAAGLSRSWSHDRAHGFFSRAVWSADQVGLALFRLIVRHLLPDGAAVTVAVDDTLVKRCGAKVFGAAWQHDGAARHPRRLGRGCCFVVVAVVVQLPMLARPVGLPVGARLWRPKHGSSKVEIAAELLRLLAACHPGRRLHAVADAAYHGKPLRTLPENVTYTTRLPANAVLYDLAPPRTGKRGRPALKGARLGTAREAAATLPFTGHQVTRYQRTELVYLAETLCLWYGSLHTTTLRLILLRDENTPDGYDLALVTTDPTTPAAALITRYAQRWSIEVTFAESREVLGLGQAENRTQAAVERTTPFGLYCYTITVTWYTLHGHHPHDAANHRHRAPWYTTKTDPSVADMTAKLRRVIIAARFPPTHPDQPTHAEIRAVTHAWATASTNTAT